MDYNSTTEKLILNYLIDNQDIEQFNTNVNYFQKQDINDVFITILELYNKQKKIIVNPIIINKTLLDKNKNVPVNIIETILKKSEQELDEDWIKNIVNKWKEEVFGRQKLLELYNNVKEGNYKDLYEIYKQQNISDDFEPLENVDVYSTPTIDKGVFETLPPILKEIFELLEQIREKDIVFTASMGVISVLFPSVFMIWRRDKDRPNIYSFIGGKAASNKGKMKHSENLLYEYKKQEMIENDIQKTTIELYNSNLQKGDTPKTYHPKYTTIPANSSSAAFTEIIKDNGGVGLVFTTEADHFVQARKQDWGNYEAMLRTAFHNETLSSKRVGVDMVVINEPYISSVMSGTMDQLIEMFDGKSENGLFSRFIFYLYQGNTDWERDDMISSGETYDSLFKKYGSDIYKVFDFYKNKPIEIIMSKEQKNYFDNQMEKIDNKYRIDLGDNFTSSVRRMAVITRKIIMIFTLFRNYSPDKIINDENLFDIGNFDNTIECEWKDVYNGISLAKTYIQHTALLFNSFKYNGKIKRETIIKVEPKSILFNKMEKEFTTKDFMDEGLKLKINQRSLQRHLQKLLEGEIIEKSDRGKYIKK